MASFCPTGETFTAQRSLAVQGGIHNREAEREENAICHGSGDFNQAEVNEKDPAFSQDC